MHACWAFLLSVWRRFGSFTAYRVPCEVSDQTARMRSPLRSLIRPRMRSLIWVFAWCTYSPVGNILLWLICYQVLSFRLFSASANVCNVFLMRNSELSEGIAVMDHDRNVVGTSKIAAKKVRDIIHICLERNGFCSYVPFISCMLFCIGKLPQIRKLLSVTALITSTADDILIFVLFFRENNAWHFMWVV